MNPTRPTGASSSSAPTTGGGAASSSAKILAVSNSSESSETTDDELASLVAQASEGRKECWPEPVSSQVLISQMSMGATSSQGASNSSANVAPAQSLLPPIPDPGQDELFYLLAELCPDVTPDEAEEIFPSDPVRRAIIVRELKKARAAEDLALMMEILNTTSSCGSLRRSLEQSRSKK